MEFSQTKFSPTALLKNVAIALLFSVVLGPVGLLYASWWGGVFMLMLGFIIFSAKLIVPIILFWIGCSVWAVAAVNRHNKKIMQSFLQ